MKNNQQSSCGDHYDAKCRVTGKVGTSMITATEPGPTILQARDFLGIWICPVSSRCLAREFQKAGEELSYSHRRK
jgi:hypothetical protein